MATSLHKDWFISLTPDPPHKLSTRWISVESLLDRHRRDEDLKLKGLDDKTVDYGLIIGRTSRERNFNENTTDFHLPNISRAHACLNLTPNGHLYLIDLEARHGTAIDPLSGRQFDLRPFQPTQILNGDTIVLGRPMISNQTNMGPLRLKVKFRYPELGKPRATFRKIIKTYDVAWASKHFVDVSDLAMIQDLLREMKDETPPETMRATAGSVHEARGDDESLSDGGIESQGSKNRATTRYRVPDTILYQSEHEEDLPRSRTSQRASPAMFSQAVIEVAAETQMPSNVVNDRNYNDDFSVDVSSDYGEEAGETPPSDEALPNTPKRPGSPVMAPLLDSEAPEDTSVIVPEGAQSPAAESRPAMMRLEQPASSAYPPRAIVSIADVGKLYSPIASPEYFPASLRPDLEDFHALDRDPDYGKFYSYSSDADDGEDYFDGRGGPLPQDVEHRSDVAEAAEIQGEDRIGSPEPTSTAFNILPLDGSEAVVAFGYAEITHESPVTEPDVESKEGEGEGEDGEDEDQLSDEMSDPGTSLHSDIGASDDENLDDESSMSSASDPQESEFGELRVCPYADEWTEQDVLEYGEENAEVYYQHTSDGPDEEDESEDEDLASGDGAEEVSVKAPGDDESDGVVAAVDEADNVDEGEDHASESARIPADREDSSHDSDDGPEQEPIRSVSRDELDGNVDGVIRSIFADTTIRPIAQDDDDTMTEPSEAAAKSMNEGRKSHQRTPSASDHSDMIVTPPSRKRTLEDLLNDEPAIHDQEEGEDRVVDRKGAEVRGSTPPPAKMTKLSTGDQGRSPSTRKPKGRSIASTVGLVVLGAALGSVGTIAGLMQIASE